jgi:hypothetical protein
LKNRRVPSFTDLRRRIIMDITKIALIAYTIITAMIAWYTKKNYDLAREIKSMNETLQKRDEEFREQVSDLYKAIVIATLISGPSGYELDGNRVLGKFRQLYNGKTEIFAKQ